MDLGLRGRSCIVTGGSGGIGGASARTLCSEHAANVVGAAWSVDGGAVPVII
jgi:NAD(P)-dependent dehydrogenase (short-subunit alcohol dehydrogenase family)